MNKHTPGPWRVRVMPNADGLICVVPDNNLSVADCCDMADAKLIAAAPALLAALTEMLNDAEGLNEPFRNEALCEKARKAIKDATS